MRKSESLAFLDSHSLTRLLIYFSICFYFHLGWAQNNYPTNYDASPLVLDPDLLGPRYSDAKKLMDQHKWDEANVALRKLREKDPASLPILYALTRCLVYKGHRDEALYLLIHEAGKRSGNQKADLMRRVRATSRTFITNKTFQEFQDGLNFLIGKKYRLAQEKFEKVLVEEPDNAEALTRVGQCLLLDGDAKEAVRRLRTAKQLNPFESEIKLWLGRALFQEGSITEAIVNLKAAHAESSSSEWSTVWLAEALTSQGQTSSAIRLLEASLKQSPFHVPELMMIAKLRTQGRTDLPSFWQARKDLQLALSRLDPYFETDPMIGTSELGLDLRKTPAELRVEIQRLLQQVQTRIDQTPAQR